jgi:hypothetical protein
MLDQHKVLRNAGLTPGTMRSNQPLMEKFAKLDGGKRPGICLPKLVWGKKLKYHM